MYWDMECTIKAPKWRLLSCYSSLVMQLVCAVRVVYGARVLKVAIESRIQQRSGGSMQTPLVLPRCQSHKLFFHTSEMIEA